MIFIVVKREELLQVDDKTRIDVEGTFSEDEAITKIEISPFIGSQFYDVTTNKYLDWQYDSAEQKLVTVRVNGYKEGFRTINVITAEDDRLFSSDADLLESEPDVLGFVVKGRSSFLNTHREAQKRILQRLEEKQIFDSSGDKLTKEAIIQLDEVRDWSKYYALEIIYYGLSNAVGDIFQLKGDQYRLLRERAENRSFIRLDINGDGTEDRAKKLSVGSLNRR